jgi:hypothetical protein
MKNSKLRFLIPRTRFDFFLVIAICGVLLSWAYTKFLASRPAGQKDKRLFAASKEFFVAPEKIDYDLVRIHRTAEDEIAQQMLLRWQARGRNESVVAVYESPMIPYKPVFFFGAAKGGGLDRHKILEEEIRIFEGKMGHGDKMTELPQDGLIFLCAPFQRGTGLVALSAICVWDDGDSVGFGLRIAGGDLTDTLRYTAEARKLLKNPPPPPPFPFPQEPPLVAPQNESEINRTIRDIVSALLSYNCARVSGFLPAGSEDMLRARIDKNVLITIKDPIEKVCFVLSIIRFPRSETMLIRQRDGKTDRAVLDLLSRDDPNSIVEFALVKTPDGWKIDPDWALKQVQDYPVKMSLLQFAMNQQGRSSYSDTPMSKNSDRGMANPNSESDKVYATFSSDRQSICGSALSESRELFLIHLNAKKNASYARGFSLPSECPIQSQNPRW